MIWNWIRTRWIRWEMFWISKKLNWIKNRMTLREKIKYCSKQLDYNRDFESIWKIFDEDWARFRKERLINLIRELGIENELREALNDVKP